jgi:putative FmdB family regulatory protein
MPIYAYRCAACGHTKDVLRKMSDPPLTECPVCGEPRFEKQVTAAGFQLKGSGWYATDFKGGAPAAPAAAAPGGEASTPAATPAAATSAPAAASPAPASSAN